LAKKMGRNIRVVEYQVLINMREMCVYGKGFWIVE